MTTNPDLDQAREWAKDVHPGHHPEAVATAKVINALPDTIVDGEELRSQIERVRRAADDFTEDRYARGMLKALEAFECLLPAPDPRKTLADMTEEERKACRWMQAEVPDLDTPVVILQFWGNGCALLSSEGVVETDQFPNVTPRPDLPRMVWPKDAPEVEEGTYGQALWDMVKKAIRDEKEYHIDAQDYEGVKRWRDVERALSTAMETNPPKETPDLPQPEDVKPDPQPGEAWLIEYEGKRYEAVYWYSPLYAHWSFVVNREGLYTVESPEATPVSRIVPEDTHE